MAHPIKPSEPQRNHPMIKDCVICDPTFLSTSLLGRGNDWQTCWPQQLKFQKESGDKYHCNQIWINESSFTASILTATMGHTLAAPEVVCTGHPSVEFQKCPHFPWKHIGPYPRKQWEPPLLLPSALGESATASSDTDIPGRGWGHMPWGTSRWWWGCHLNPLPWYKFRGPSPLVSRGNSS